MDLFVIPYPVIDPVAIELGPVAIRWYGLAYMAGILLGWLYGRYLVSRPALWGGKSPMTVPQADDFLLWITLGIVVGGRLGFVVFYEPSYFWANPIEIPAALNASPMKLWSSPDMIFSSELLPAPFRPSTPILAP